MKKIVFILITLLCLCSCARDYKCVVTYQISYPDTSWVHTYTFDGAYDAHPSIYRASSGRKVLTVYPYEINIPSYEIAAVPREDTDITILDFKIYRYDIDIPKKKK